MTTASTTHGATATLSTRLIAGVAGGLAGGIVFGVLMQMMDMMGMVAMLVGSESIAVGWLVHLFNSALFGNHDPLRAADDERALRRHPGGPGSACSKRAASCVGRLAFPVGCHGCWQPTTRVHSPLYRSGLHLWPGVYHRADVSSFPRSKDRQA